MISFSLTYGSPASLFQGTAYSGALHRHRNKNWCAFIVQKNVSCAVQGNVESFVQPEVAPCPTHQPDCEQQVMYRSQFRPTYRISYKTVTELEWRCCPGYQGPDCTELKGTPNRQTVLEPEPRPHPLPRPGQARHTQRPERREIGRHGIRSSGVDKARQLEAEMHRLSQTVQDLQAAMSNMADNLRTDFQVDANKMLVTLLNNMSPPDSAKTGDSEENGAHLDGHQATKGRTFGEKGMEEVMARLNDMTDALKSKDKELEELRGALSGQEGQIRMLMDASQGPPITVGDASDIDILQSYIDGKFEKLRKDLAQEMEDNVATLKSTCDDKIQSVQKACDDSRENRYVSLTQLVDNKEADLRKEIRDLRLDLAKSDGLVRTHRQTTPARRNEDDGDLRQEVERIAEAHRILNARVDNELEHLSMLQLEDLFGPRIEELEDRMNVTERNAEAHSFFVQEKLSKDIADEVAKLHQLLDERLNVMEDQFTTMLVEMSNSSFPGMLSGTVDAMQNEVNSHKYLIQGMEDKLNAIAQTCTTDCKSSSETPTPTSMDSLVKDVQICRNDLDALHSAVRNNADKLTELKNIVGQLSSDDSRNKLNMQDFQSRLTSLQDNVNGLTGAVTGLGDFVSKYSQDLQSLNFTCCQAGQIGRVQMPSQPVGRGTVTDRQVEQLRTRLDRLSTQVTTELSSCKKSTDEVAEDVVAMDSRVANLEKICGQTDGVKNVQDVKENLERHIARLWDIVRQVNSTQRSHSGDISNLQRSLQNCQIQLSGIANQILKDVTAKEQGAPVKQERPGSATDSGTPTLPRRSTIHHIHIPLNIPFPATIHPPVHRPPTVHQPPYPRQPHRPQQPTNHRQPSSLPHQPTLNVAPIPRRPVLEAGEAGPPGTMRRVTVRRNQGSESSINPIKGFAGAPEAHVLWNPASKTPVATPVQSENNALFDPFSFSAGLTQRSLVGDFGIILFDKILVNDGGYYNPQTGIFYVPQDGRYLITAVLTAQRGEHVEAVLSVSNRSVQKLDTAGYQDTSLPWMTQDRCACGGSASISLILPLRRGDRVSLVRTAGKLAFSDAREMLSTFSAVYLYTPQTRR
ncbi:EMILIN-2 [Chanos chanos]|uniref:EMILIN-2 n=1 Tax=Chanos chanos TaxID=29144 RepID=A0A6J2VEU3_CHACN|nr:EMILIN-2-like [Chanos chanos]